MTAKEMFEELGYTLEENSECFITYSTGEGLCREYITFYLTDKFYRTNLAFCSFQKEWDKATKKQIKELGW